MAYTTNSGYAVALRDDDLGGCGMARAAEQGQLVGSRYQLLEPLGAGGFGRVWRAHDTRFEIDVAVKELWLPPMTSRSEQNERLQRAEREARNAARLRDHKHIVTVYDVVLDRELPWIIMQLVRGTSLHERVVRRGPVPRRAVRDIAVAMLDALDSAHQAGIVHRDIKPANILLAEGQSLLTDFGIAHHESDVRLTSTGAVLGSVAYLAPERAIGRDNGPPGDLFSLGVTLYEAVEGVSPFARDSSAASLHAVAYEDPPPLRRAGELTPLISALLTKKPDERPSIDEARRLLRGPETVRTTGSNRTQENDKGPTARSGQNLDEDDEDDDDARGPRPDLEERIPKAIAKALLVALLSGTLGLGLYATHEGSAAVISMVVHDEVNAQTDLNDCVGYIGADKEWKWKALPCWSAAASHTVVHRIDETDEQQSCLQWSSYDVDIIETAARSHPERLLCLEEK